MEIKVTISKEDYDMLVEAKNTLDNKCNEYLKDGMKELEIALNNIKEERLDMNKQFCEKMKDFEDNKGYYRINENVYNKYSFPIYELINKERLKELFNNK